MADKEKWLPNEEHLTDEHLVTLLDGEHTSREAAQWGAHLERCWVCRARQENLKRSIAAFIDNRHSVLSDDVPPPPNQWRSFEFRLQQAVREAAVTAPRPHFWRRSLSLAHAATAAAVVVIGLWGYPLVLQIGALLNQQPAATTARKTAPAPTIVKPLPPRAAAPVVAMRIPPPKPAPIVEPPPVVVPPPAPDLEAVEVATWYALHREGACIGEQVDILRADGTVIVRGLVETAERRQQIRTALGDSPYRTLEIRTFEEASHDLRPAATEEPPRVERVKNSRRSSAEPLRPFLDPQATIDAVDAVSLAGASLRHAWALRKLSEAFSAGRMARMKPESRTLMTAMALEHAAQWQAILGQYRARVVRPLVVPDGEPQTAATIADLFDRAQSLDRLTRGLFADTDDPVADPRQAIEELRAALAAIEDRLTRPDDLARAFEIRGNIP